MNEETDESAVMEKPRSQASNTANEKNVRDLKEDERAQAFPSPSWVNERAATGPTYGNRHSWDAGRLL